MKRRLTLVGDWKRCWRWASMRWSLGGVTFNIIAACLLKGITVSVAFLGFIPLMWIPLIAVVIGLVGMFGRVTKRAPKVRPWPKSWP